MSPDFLLRVPKAPSVRDLNEIASGFLQITVRGVLWLPDAKKNESARLVYHLIARLFTQASVLLSAWMDEVLEAGLLHS